MSSPLGARPEKDARLSFTATLQASRHSTLVPVIPDIKWRSPKEGRLLRDLSPAEYAVALAEAGAPAISVVTEPDHFGGSLEMLASVTAAVSAGVPILRKDFIQEESELQATVDAGAHAVLLIAAHLTDDRLRALVAEARRIGIESLVEVHDVSELRRVLAVDFDCLGINNRDIVNLERDEGSVATSESLASLVPQGTPWISESGIRTPTEARRAVESGATAVLVGTELLAAKDPVRRWQQLSGVPNA